MINNPRENVPWLIKSFLTRTEQENNSIYYVDQHHRMFNIRPGRDDIILQLNCNELLPIR